MDEPTIPQPAEGATPDAASGDGPVDLKQQVVEAICLVYDPEIPVNIYELGLIYDVEVTP